MVRHSRLVRSKSYACEERNLSNSSFCSRCAIVFKIPSFPFSLILLPASVSSSQTTPRFLPTFSLNPSYISGFIHGPFFSSKIFPSMLIFYGRFLSFSPFSSFPQHSTRFCCLRKAVSSSHFATEAHFAPVVYVSFLKSCSLTFSGTVWSNTNWSS